MTKILINGIEDTNIDVRDRGFSYGDGVFETIAFKNNKLQLWDEHLQRLHQACQRLALKSVDENTWLEDIKKLQLEEDAVVKLSISRGVSGRGYVYDQADEVTRVTAIYDWPEYTETNQQGITARFCETPVSVNSALAGIKHLNRLDNVLARNEWNDADIVEGFMLDFNQHVIEGTMSNVFCVLDDELYTPLLESSGVAGVMRQRVIKLAEEMGVTVNAIEISKQNFLQMDAVFVTNSLIAIWPVSKIIGNENDVVFSQNDIVMNLQSNLNRILS